MDLSKLKSKSARSIVLYTGFGIVALVVFSGVMGAMRSSLSLSGGVATLSAPTAPGMMGGAYFRNEAQGVAYDSVGVQSAKSVAMGVSSVPEMVQPPTPTGDAPAGVSKIIKNGNLSLLVRNVDEAATAITALRVALMGQPGNASFSEYGNGGKQGDMTIWVPSEKFDDAMTAIKKLALRVNNESVSVEDVSAQFVDLEARLKTLKVTEAQYQELMKRSGKISEVLEVTRYLNDTRTQIEQTQGQMDYLSRQVALSSIHISLTQEAIPGSTVSKEWRPMTVVKAALAKALSDLTNFIDQLIVMLIGLPMLLLNLLFWLVVIYGFWRLGKFVFRHFKDQTSS